MRSGIGSLPSMRNRGPPDIGRGAGIRVDCGGVRGVENAVQLPPGDPRRHRRHAAPAWPRLGQPIGAASALRGGWADLRGAVPAQHGQQILIRSDEVGLVPGPEPGAAPGRVLQQLLIAGPVVAGPAVRSPGWPDGTRGPGSPGRPPGSCWAARSSLRGGPLGQVVFTARSAGDPSPETFVVTAPAAERDLAQTEVAATAGEGRPGRARPEPAVIVEPGGRQVPEDFAGVGPAAE